MEVFEVQWVGKSITVFCQNSANCTENAAQVAERYTRLLANWYQQTVSLAYANSETPDTKRLWVALMSSYKEIVGSTDVQLGPFGSRFTDFA